MDVKLALELPDLPESTWQDLLGLAIERVMIVAEAIVTATVIGVALGVATYRTDRSFTTCGTPARHCCLRRASSPRVIMETLGHSVIGTTINRYTHVMPVTQRAAASQMHQLLRGEGS